MGCYVSRREEGMQDDMKVLVIGSGGREHALCWAIAASPLCDEVLCAPGNGGIAEVARCIAIDAMDFDAFVTLCRDESIAFVVVGPEAPLVAGLVDRLDAEGIDAFGPNAAAARLEGSKAFTKTLCEENGIPAAASRSFNDAAAAAVYIESHGAPVVIKADGLAAGKGVTVAQTLDEALAANATIGSFGAAGSTILVEDLLVGEEASFFALVDGKTALALVGAQDHKAVGDGDVGPNTGGMGAYSPAPILDSAMADRVMAEIIMPTVRAMAAAGTPFKGVLYAGLMIDEQGPKLLEYNVRFGDPECQVLLSRLRSDLLPALMATHDGELANFDLRWRDEAALCVVMASEGYPGSYEKGSEIRGLDCLDADDLVVFHAGTARCNDRLVATGGRVLGVTARAAGVAEAQARAYQAVAHIDWPQGFCRRDIGWRAVARGV